MEEHCSLHIGSCWAQSVTFHPAKDITCVIEPSWGLFFCWLVYKFVQKREWEQYSQLQTRQAIVKLCKQPTKMSCPGSHLQEVDAYESWDHYIHFIAFKNGNFYMHNFNTQVFTSTTYYLSLHLHCILHYQILRHYVVNYSIVTYYFTLLFIYNVYYNTNVRTITLYTVLNCTSKH